MISRSITFFILSTFIITAAKCGSHFELFKNSGQQIGGQGSVSAASFHNAFFHCDMEPKCTHVIKRDGSEEHFMVHGEDALKKMTHVATIWKKMAIESESKVQQSISNIALGKPAALSRIVIDMLTASLAVDGSKKNADFTSCAITHYDNPSWLRVDLQATAMVQSVNILSLDGLTRVMKAIDVRAGNSLHNGGTGNPPCQLGVTIPTNSASMDVQCPSDMTARYVIVNTSGVGKIEICEIEVYGYYV